MRPIRQAMLLLAGLVAGSACQRTSPANTHTFACGDVRFDITFEDSVARVILSGDTLRLSQAVSASGARYANETVEFWEHQGTARLLLPDTTYADCRPL